MENNSNFYIEPVFKIGTAAKFLEVAVPTLRMYESAGLIIPFRTKTKRRLYSRHDISYLKIIRDLIRNQRLNLEGIKKLLSIVPCWIINKCDKDIYQNCSAYNENSVPCWLKTDTLCEKSLEICRTCKVYIECPSILKEPKKLFKLTNINTK